MNVYFLKSPSWPGMSISIEFSFITVNNKCQRQRDAACTSTLGMYCVY